MSASSPTAAASVDSPTGPPANDVQTAVIPGAGHWFAEEAPEETVSTLTTFLAPYREAVHA